MFTRFLTTLVFLRFQLNTIKLISDIASNKKSFNDFFKKKKVQKNFKTYYRKHLNGLQYRIKLKKFNVKRSKKRKAFRKRLLVLLNQVADIPIKHDILSPAGNSFLTLKKPVCLEALVLLRRSNSRVMKGLLKKLVTVNVIREGTIIRKVYRQRSTYITRIR